MRLAAVDLDGTLCEEGEQLTSDIEQNKKMFLLKKPILNAISKVNTAFERGWYIAIWTNRSSLYKKQTEIWLNTQGVKYWELVMDKGMSPDVFIDSRNRTIESWDIGKQ